MTDEIFHLTPLDVRRYEFGRVMRGYDPARVDQFREQVADELERLTRLNQELEQKARGFHDQLKSFRERDKALNEALVSAQQLRSEMKEQAERESQLTLREAQVQAERILSEAQSDIRRLEDELAALERFRRNYLTQLRAFVERQLAEISAAEAAPSIHSSRRE
jgi:DivIVA domain-containing protein